MTIVLGIEKTHDTDGEDRFAMQLVEERSSWSGDWYASLTIEDLPEDMVRRIGGSRSLSTADLDEYLRLARASYGQIRQV